MAGGDDVIRGEDRLLTPGEVARVFRVHPKTLSRWAAAGLITSFRATPTSHRRFRESEVRKLIEGGTDGNVDPRA